MPPFRILAFVGIMLLTGSSSGVYARGGFGGPPGLGLPGVPGGIEGPQGGFGLGRSFGLGGPLLGTGLAAHQSALSAPLRGAGSTVKHLVTLPSQAATAISRTVARDEVGRPADSTIVSQVLAHDAQGHEVVRSEIVAISPTSADLAVAKRLHFKVLRRDRLPALGLVCITLRAPGDMTTIAALTLLRHADPLGNFDYSSIYNPAGSALPSANSEAKPISVPAGEMTLGMIDGGVDRRHPSLTRSHITVRTFAGGDKSIPTRHGTAIASLLVGFGRKYSGYLPGANLYAADVYGGVADGGSAVDIARALNWLAKHHIAVTNISLAGPPNMLLAAAVRAFIRTGHALVAAAGNDGPAAPPNYPAAYPGVICVTSVDVAKRVELDANRRHCKFAALGVDVRAAKLPRGYGKFTGTSYATPVVTAHVAELMQKPDVVVLRHMPSMLLRRATRVRGGDARPLYIIGLSGQSQPRSIN